MSKGHHRLSRQKIIFTYKSFPQRFNSLMHIKMSKSFCSKSGSHADAFVVVDVFDGNLSALFRDVIEAGLGGAFGHQYNRFLTEFIRSPRYTAPVIPVGRSKKGSLSEFFPQFFAG